MTTKPTEKAIERFNSWNDGSREAPRRVWSTIEEVKAANKEIGNYFFSRDTMRFFSSRIATGIIGDRYFITSEKRSFDDSRRGFTIRLVSDTGSIHTIGELNDYGTLHQAKAALARLLEGGEA